MLQTIGVCGTGNMGRAIVKGLVAAKTIAADHIYLYNIHREKAEALAQETGAVVVCEEHQIMGGLGGAICEALAQHCCVPVELVGIQDRFGESGRPDDLLKAYNLSASDVIQAVHKVLKRK